jgi:uncharacterized protein (DUF433 family)
LNSFLSDFRFIGMRNLSAQSSDNDFLLRIVSDSDTLRGKPRIKGTRIAVYMIIQMIAAGETVETILEDYPSLTKEDIKAALRYGARLAEYEAYAL